MYSAEGTVIKGFSPSLKGSLDKYQEDLYRDLSRIALFNEILIDLFPNRIAIEIKEGAIASNCLNSL